MRVTNEIWDLLIPLNNFLLFTVTVPITDATSFFAPGFAPSPTVSTASPFIPTLPFELIKNWNTGAIFSQVSAQLLSWKCVLEANFETHFCDPTRANSCRNKSSSFVCISMWLADIFFQFFFLLRLSIEKRKISFFMLCQRKEGKSSHNFLHNKIVTFSYCVLKMYSKGKVFLCKA